MAVKKKAPVKKTATKRRVVKKKAPVKKRVIKRFKNPIKGIKAPKFYAAYIESDGERYYYGGSKKNAQPIFDSDIKKAFISHEKTPMVNHVHAETRQHIQGRGYKIKIIPVYVDDKGRIIPGE